ncbi:hypothetical protein ES707_16921 [subsurface metagenome]
MSTITKRVFLNTMVCPTLGRITNSEPSKQSKSISDILRMEEGIEIHERARTVFPEGHFIKDDNITTPEKTQEILKDESIRVIFEATFLANGFIAKADILIRQSSGWHILEVKSGVNDKKEYLDDLAYTAMVAGNAGLEISECSLMLLSRDYRLGMENDKLFTEINHTEEVLLQAKEFTDHCDVIRQIISLDSKPDVELKWECKGCDIFKECFDQGIENHIFDLPRLGEKKFQKLVASAILRIEDVPEDFKLTPPQVKVRDAVKSGKTFVNKVGINDALNSISFPTYNLDFETVQTAIPLYSDIPPYAQIPTQYSIHICSSQGQIDGHFDYLADPMKDCRRELAEKLISDCGNKGSIIVYTSFEKTRLKALIGLFPDLEKPLNTLLERIIDINKLISDNLYHPEFHGSYSIKRVLPVLVPDLGYEDMDVSNGQDASATFAYMAKGKYDDEEAKDKRKQLLEYCKLDTLAMVKLHEHLTEYI